MSAASFFCFCWRLDGTIDTPEAAGRAAAAAVVGSPSEQQKFGYGACADRCGDCASCPPVLAGAAGEADRPDEDVKPAPAEDVNPWSPSLATLPCCAPLDVKSSSRSSLCQDAIQSDITLHIALHVLHRNLAEIAVAGQNIDLAPAGLHTAACRVLTCR